MTPADALPATLDAAAIAARIPHQGAMCLLERLDAWSAGRIACSTATHLDPANPLRTARGLLAPAAIEYAAQAMALHGSLVAPADGSSEPGYLASVRGVRFAGPRLDAVAGRLRVEAERLAGDARQIQYRFSVGDDAGVFAEGRAIVVLNPPVPVPPVPDRP